MRRRRREKALTERSKGDDDGGGRKPMPDSSLGLTRIHAAAPLMMSKSDHPNTKVDVDYDHKPSDNFTPLDPPIVSATTGNPFLRAGSGATIECTENLNDFLLRVDMPGVGRDGMKVWVNNGDVQVSGAEPPGEPTKRVYRGAMDLPALPHRADEMRVDIKNGVLKIAIPKG
ncbi:hypothetical protein RJ640_006713 [Escallonia rubra]|uniref:SHSP domain-containing protein n=1 Tax=Escallonia rubra TaxID=112253 RepID=A0AA88R5M7_9ASTE|nr:hypothetical protein RJ640_006713 [Escallonia rubra]